MEMSKTSKQNLPEMRVRAVCIVVEHQSYYETQGAAAAAFTSKIGCITETENDWLRQAELDNGMRDGATSAGRDRIMYLDHAVKQLRQANAILRKASA